MLVYETRPTGEVVVPFDGPLLLETPIYNKGTAFPQSERVEFGLEGLLPPHVTDLDEQTERVWEELCFMPSQEQRHIYLRSLQDRNEVLFYNLLLSHLEETMPLIYTPVVGWACRHFSHIYRRPRGLFIAHPNRDNIARILRHRPFRDVDVIVVTDGERILGLGDQGAGGMGIPIGKLSLYTLCGGIHPARTLPIVLDCGTDNEERLRDPHYLGWRHPRIRGEDYVAFMDAFVRAVRDEFPGVLLQWEDFSRDNASFLLERYQDDLCTFNDDIQGTAAVTLAAMLSALEITNAGLADVRMVLLGAGSAAVGIADLFLAALAKRGISERDALQSVWLLNSRGLVTEDIEGLQPFQRKFAKSSDDLSGWPPPKGGRYGLAEVVNIVKPNTLIGVSGQPGLFTEEVVRSIARAAPHPIILPLSNPTSRSEAVPEDLLRWTEGRAIVATGSPFPPVLLHGRDHPIAQCNNSYVFPGLGLGVLASGAKRVLPSMFLAGAEELSRCALEAGKGEAVLPPLASIREVSRRIALAVAEEAVRTQVAEPASRESLESRIASLTWSPAYPTLTRA